MVKHILVGLFSLGLGCAALGADAWPSRPINLVVGYTSGGNTDLAARILANSMKQSVPVSVVVENKPGAGGTLGANHVVRSSPDGHVLLVASQSETSMLKANRLKPPYDIDKDLVPIAKLIEYSFVLNVPKGINVSTWKDFVAYAKSKDSLTYATPGIGTTAHLMSEHLLLSMGVKGVHVPYPGAAALRTDLLAGRVDFSIDVLPLVTQYISSGGLRAIAVTGSRRDPKLPEVPSLVELGVFPEQYAGWTGVFAPKATPPEVRAKILVLINQMLKGGGAEEIQQGGYRPASPDQRPNDFPEFISQDQERWLKIFKLTGVPPAQ